jgi:LysR family transcriptional regulator, flagellar master operon regulator
MAQRRALMQGWNMDITLLKTFLEVSSRGSFAEASQRLFVTQSAVSLRIQRLEDSLGQTLFTRSKAGAAMTPQGRQFEVYALALVRTWEEARQQVAVPDGFATSLSIGAQYSLWPRLGFRLIDRFRDKHPEISLRAELGMPDRLTRFLVEGVMQVALLYVPTIRPGLAARKIFDEDLVLAASWPDPTMDLGDRYAFVDWGPEFLHAHALTLPELTNPGLTLALGALSAEFISRRQFAAYLPARAVKPYVDSGKLYLVPGAPTFPYPAWMVWREDHTPEVIEKVHAAMDWVTETVDRETETVFEQLSRVNQGHFPDEMGS